MSSETGLERIGQALDYFIWMPAIGQPYIHLLKNALPFRYSQSYDSCLCIRQHVGLAFHPLLPRSWGIVIRKKADLQTNLTWMSMTRIR